MKNSDESATTGRSQALRRWFGRLGCFLTGIPLGLVLSLLVAGVANALLKAHGRETRGEWATVLAGLGLGGGGLRLWITKRQDLAALATGVGIGIALGSGFLIVFTESFPWC